MNIFNHLSRRDTMFTRPIISLITDFGLQDEYVGTIKGVILSIQPDAVIVDISHAIPPQDIATGAFVLSRSYPFFPENSIHLLIVDPGVGTERDILAIQANNRFYIGPDNGILTPILIDSEKLQHIYRVTDTASFPVIRSTTFHGRDIMAPLAARLACGLALCEVGTAINQEECQFVSPPIVHNTDDSLIGEVIHVDRFGNLCTNLTQKMLVNFTGRRKIHVAIGTAEIKGISRCYADGNGQSLLALFDSHDHLEIPLSGGSAAEYLQVSRGAAVTLSCWVDQSD
jgi:S-adenosyl-L-methionine hydrolase (adenosine-forming)